MLKRAYYKLPYKLRQRCYATLRPRSFAYFQSMRGQGAFEAGGPPSVAPFLEQKTIFVHIPKSAGISIYRSLFGADDGIGHYSVESLQLIFSQEEFSEYFKFAFVRDPWDRLHSAYSFLRNGGLHEGDREWARENIAQFDCFEDFVLRWVNPDNIMLRYHFRPQYQYICLPGHDRPLVDFIGRYENLEGDFSFVAEKIGRPDATLRRENSTSNRIKKTKADYTKKMNQIVEAVYKKDIEIFGYRP